MSALYKRPLIATRTGPLFSAFPYPTKISPEVIALFIASHTKPGDTVFDGFAGSGTTGVGALLCGNPTEAMRAYAKKLGLRVHWGARRAVLYELGVLGSVIAGTLCDPPEVDQFRREAERILSECEGELAWMYEARDPGGNAGSIRYVVWSELVQCANCGKSVTVWEGCVRRRPARINAKVRCPYCDRQTNLSDARRRTKIATDELLKEGVLGRIRRPAWVYGRTGSRAWSREVNASDRSLLSRIARTSLSAHIPVVKVPWGDLYRSGYHQGITHLHHFYTRRNLIVFSSLWAKVNSSPLRDALRFWLLSYNASHGTLMTRVVAKKAQADLVVTSAQPGVLYISGLPVEKNLFAGLRKKLHTINCAFEATARERRLVTVVQGSSLQTDLADHSVDYVFTDPPFGGNIPYAEVNFINEAWLGRCTDAHDEVTISKVQGKDTAAYESMMTRAFKEIHRVLKSDGKATVVFHSSSSAVWNALQRAYRGAKLSVQLASVLAKAQGSFKQVTTSGSVKGDPVLLLTQDRRRRKAVTEELHPVLDELLQLARVSPDGVELTPQRLYSRFVTYYLTKDQSVPLSAEQFYQFVAERESETDARCPLE